MATGEQPFPGETMTAVSYKIVHTEPVPPAKLNPAIPAKLESVILKCLAKSPANRYQTGEELAQDLALLCADSKALSLQSTAPLATGTGKASEETFDLNPGQPSKPLPASEITAMEMPPRPAKKHGALLVAAAVLLVAVAAGGVYLLHHRQPAAPASAPAASAQPAMTPLPVPAVEPETAPTEAPAASPAPRAQTPSVAFDPKTLDPKQNTRLKLELDHFPAGLAFTIAMNGKTYFKGSAGNKAEYDNLFVPPGVHEFRVTVRGGSVQKASNIVSAEFLANKRMVLKVEFRPSANGSSGASSALDPAAQIVASLKAERFFR
jgi:serine/threonine-protein kinase